MAIGQTSYPAALDTADTLVQAANLCPATATTDTGGVGANSVGGTTIAVTSTTGYPTSGTITIDNEIITYASLTGTTFAGCVRGVDGTTAAVHASGAAVNGYETALHHNVLANAVIAAETKVGSGAATPANNQVLAGTGAGTSTWTGAPTLTSLAFSTPAGAIAQEAYTVPTLLNSWAVSSAIPEFFKDTQGIVHVFGGVYNGAGNTSPWTFPAGYRPSSPRYFVHNASAGASNYTQVATSGVLTITTGTVCYFDTMSFDSR